MTFKFVSLLLIILLTTTVSIESLDIQTEILSEDETISKLEHQNPNCEPIKIEFCEKSPYNLTMMPNHLNHQTQDDAARELYSFSTLVKMHCSPDLQFFLCLMYVPVCTLLEKPLKPCREICIQAKRGCESTLTSFGFKWPAQFDCDKLPRFEAGTTDPNKMCVGTNETSEITTMSPPLGAHWPQKLPKLPKLSGYDMAGARDLGFSCPEQFRVPPEHGYSLNVGGKIVDNCGAPCDSMFFNETEKRISRLWIGSWATLCAASCFFTFLTFLIDTDRFRYPERPIIFLSVCYMMVSIVYVIGWIANDQISCRPPFPPREQYLFNRVSTITQGTKYEWCTLLFMVLYFFGMASSIWWVILTLTWFLAATLKWGHEAIEAHSQYFHFFAWAIPAIKTVIILATGKVEGDVLSGVCYVGLWNVSSLQGFVLGPLIVYLSLGILFLFAGFISLYRIRTVMKLDGTKTDKLEKLIMRILLFSVLYIVPALSVIACLFYEQAYFDRWMLTWHMDMCSKSAYKSLYSIACPVGARKLNVGHRPLFWVFMIKYLMSMVVGFTSSVWVCSNKTLASWRKFFNHIRRQRSEAYV